MEPSAPPAAMNRYFCIPSFLSIKAHSANSATALCKTLQRGIGLWLLHERMMLMLSGESHRNSSHRQEALPGVIICSAIREEQRLRVNSITTTTI
jgi:hypothetical protein